MPYLSENQFRHAARRLHYGNDDSDFISMFGCSPVKCALAWNLMDTDGMEENHWL